MASKLVFRKWEWPLLALVGVLVALALLALGGVLRLPGLGARGGILPKVEVVNQQPLRVNHSPSMQPVSTADDNNEAALAGRAPRAALPLDFFDFGRVGVQSVVQHEFLLINQGSAPLIIQQAYTTCGCTTADLSARIIPPGKAARATLIFDAGFHPAAGQTVRRGLILETNDPDHPQVEIWVQAAVGW